MNCEVTIGIPVYQAADYLRVTLLSALSQTYPDIEFLIVDDCGRDGSMAIVEQLQRSHSRGGAIRILRNESNQGVGPSRNRIIEEARGRYLYFMDSDDLIEPHTIQLMMDAASRHDADVVYASYEKVDNVGHTATQVFSYPSLSLLEPDQLALYAFRQYGRFQASVCNCLMSVSFLRSSKLRFIDAVYWEDMAFTCLMVTRVRRAVLLSEVTYHYLCRPFSLSNYQERAQLQKDEILKNVATIDYLKWHCSRLRTAPYAPYMSYNLAMNSFYIVCYTLKHRHNIVPAVSTAELRQFMHYPLPLSVVLRFRHKRLSNLFLWLSGRLPAVLLLPLVWLMGHVKKVF